MSIHLTVHTPPNVVSRRRCVGRGGVLVSIPICDLQFGAKSIIKDDLCGYPK